MLKIQLQSVVQHQAGPYPVRGISGKVHGYAREGTVPNRHTLLIPIEDWIDKGVGVDITRMMIDPISQWVAMPILTADGDEPTAKETELQKQIDALKSELASYKPSGAASASEAANLPSTVTGEPPKHLDDSAVALLRTARDLPSVQEDRIEKGEDGKLALVHRELAPSVSGSPIESKSADNVTGKETTRVPATNLLDILEERTPMEAPSEKPSDLLGQVQDHAENAAVDNQHAGVQATEQAQEQGVAAVADDNLDAAEKGGESDLAQYKSNFRKLRSIAKAEGVADVEKITSSDDMIAAIELHRESKVA